MDATTTTRRDIAMNATARRTQAFELLLIAGLPVLTLVSAALALTLVYVPG